MKLSVKALALTAGVFWGGAIFLVGTIALFANGYGTAFLEVCASVYPGFHTSGGPLAVVVGTLYGVVDGAISGALFARVYNFLAGRLSGSGSAAA